MGTSKTQTAVAVALVAALTTGAPAMTQAQPRTETLADIDVRWHFEASRLQGRLEASAPGWLLVGFNRPGAGLERARLFFFVVGADGTCRAEEHLATPPNHARRSSSEDSVRVEACGREDGRAWVRFSLSTTDPGSGLVRLVEGETVELIAAYSESDDLQHHSRRREHRVSPL